MNDFVKISKYKKSLESAWGYNDYNDWPVKFNSIMHLFMKEFSMEFLDDFNKLIKCGFELHTIAKSFGNPARIYRIINPVLYGMKQALFSVASQRNITLLMIDMVDSMKYGSAFNEDGKNILLSPYEVENLFNEKKFNTVSNNTIRTLSRLFGVAWSYTEALFFRAHDVTKEIHGPYKIQNFSNKQLVVREYKNLKNREIWTDISPFPWNEIKVYTVYTDKCNLQIDAYNHLFLNSGNLPSEMISNFIEADGQELSNEHITKAIDNMLLIITEIQDIIIKTDWKFSAKKYAEIYWYRKKPLCDLLSRNWRVPEHVFSKIENGSIDERRINNLTKHEIAKLINIIV